MKFLSRGTTPPFSNAQDPALRGSHDDLATLPEVAVLCKRFRNFQTINGLFQRFTRYYDYYSPELGAIVRNKEETTMARAARATTITQIDSHVPSRISLDDADRTIIELLQTDGRRAYGSIAEEIGLSETAVRRRVQRLRDAGALQIVAITDPLQMGFLREAMLGVRVQGDVRTVANEIAAISEAIYVVMCAGSFDILVELVVADDEHLVHVLNDQIRSVPGVIEVETFVYLKLAKQTYSWGTR